MDRSGTSTSLNIPVRDITRPVVLGIGVLYIVQTVQHMLMKTPGVTEWVVSAFAAAALLALSLVLRRWSPPAGWSHPIAGGVAVLALVNSLVTIHLLRDPIQATYLMLLMIGLGCLFLSVGWLLLILSLTLGGWIFLAWQAPSSGEWFHFGYALLCSAALSVLIQHLRLRTLARVASRRLESQAEQCSPSATPDSLEREPDEPGRFEAKLVHLSTHDYLTGLLNRDRFETELELRLARARENGTSIALLWLDLDRFKEINESLGHRGADELLVCVASLLREQLEDEDVLARLAGDEFALLMPHADNNQARAAAARLLEALRACNIVIRGQVIRVTASIGIALHPEDAVTAPVLLARADAARYQAKGMGRNRFCRHVTEGSELVPLRSKIDWVRRIREVLEEERFLLYAQDILDLKSERILQYELLLRMPDDPGKADLPGVFLDVAERFGLIREIDRWVVRKAIRLLEDHSRPANPLRLNVNISAKSLADLEILDLIEQELAETSIDPSRLTLEITETAALTNLAKAQLFINTLKKTGCRFALDDFGMGFSSFYHLKHLPVDYLKIDGSYIRDLPYDSVDQHLVQAMVQVARGLGKTTIAEFVRGERTVRLLREYGVDYAQGYYYGEPRPIAEVLKSAPGAEPARRRPSKSSKKDLLPGHEPLTVHATEVEQ